MTCVEALGRAGGRAQAAVGVLRGHGAAGVAVLERVIADARRGRRAVRGLDAKRGDIGSTMAGYAGAYLADGAPLAADAITLSPYLGFGSLDPALDPRSDAGRGVFVLARTSNPEGGARCRLGAGRCSEARWRASPSR